MDTLGRLTARIVGGLSILLVTTFPILTRILTTSGPEIFRGELGEKYVIASAIMFGITLVTGGLFLIGSSFNEDRRR